MLWRFLQHRLSLPPHAVVLHIAPEPVLARWFRKRAARYVAGDLATLPADVLLDVTALPFATDTFHAICCVHVLEHVRDDLGAMRELYRVLKPGGWAFLSTPHDASRRDTVEDEAITTPEGRLAAFGQDDHLRVYGLDLADRLRRARFEVEWTEYARTLPASEFGRQRLETHAVIVGRKDLLLEAHAAARSRPLVTLPATEGYRSPPPGRGQRPPERVGIGDPHEVAGEGE
ncbi:MAG: class I SAM-dependent methyltransferase [Gemmatimonadaceae bacterium]